MNTPLARLRRRLTLWYVAVSGLIVLITGTGLYLATRRLISRELDESLRDAVTEVIRTASLQEPDGRSSDALIADVADELETKDRPLFVFNAAGHPVRPGNAPPQIREAAERTLRSDSVHFEFETPSIQRWRAFGRPLTLADGSRYAVLVVADLAVVERQFSRFIGLYALAALVAVVLMGLGGFRLAALSARPVEEAIELRRRFMAEAAHELRTPLAVMRGRAEVALKKPRPPAEYIASLGAVELEATRLGRIVEDLLTMARADAGDRRLDIERFFLDDVASDAVGAAAVLAGPREISIDLRRYEETPVAGDPVLVRQLIMILLDNAVKFTAPGGRVSVDVFPEAAAGVLLVEDTGSGIAPEHLPHIFDRFYRGDPAAHDHRSGAGLGLSIARWIAHAHRGRLDITSAPEQGTRVTFQMPTTL